MMRDHRLGFAIQLLGEIFAAAMPFLHFNGARYPAIATSSWGFFCVWSLIVTGPTGAFAVVLAGRGLWLAFREARPEPRRG